LISRLSFQELMELLTQAREYTERNRRELAEQHAREEAAKLGGELSRERVKIESREAWVRFSLATLLIVGAVLGVLLAIAIGLDAQSVAQYLAPISGLAGIAVGYFFGRQSQG
jgi:NAD/NADP transhydrogenase beta subunit